MFQQRVLKVISQRSKNNPVTGKELMDYAQVFDKDHKEGANMRSIINALRDKGYPICANSNGYYYPQNPGELKEYIEAFQNRIDQQQKACDVLKDKLISWQAVFVRISTPFQDKMF